MADTLHDDELYLPRTVVNKLIKEIVPNIRVSTDARDLLLNCCTEFIHLLASEASDISEQQQKKVISPEHVVEALATLGFHEYVPDVKAVHKEYKEQASKHRKRGKSKLDRLGIPEEELARQQQQLFDEARQQQMETELLEQQKLQHNQLMQPCNSAESKPREITTSSVSEHSTTDTLIPVSMCSNAGKGQGSSSVGSDGTEVKQTNEGPKVMQQPPSALKPPFNQGSLPQNTAITVASLQATSNLLQQAIAMASAQMAATNNAQLSQEQPELSHQNILLQQPALQAALAAQCIAAQVQSKSQMVPQQAVQLLSKSQPVGTNSEPVSHPGLSSDVKDDVRATSQELSVAQMMMTLAQASNKQALTSHNGGNKQSQQNTPDKE